jgi:formylglycine-generating enzyme required for sulfatase activity
VVLESILAQLIAASAGACPDGMRLVEGQHHDQVQRVCTDWRMGHCFGFVPGLMAVEGRQTPVRVCMDQYEWPNRAGAKPVVMARFTEAEKSCKSVGKRLCTEVEWETACEGPAISPWPYGWKQDPSSCNATKPYMPVSEATLLSGDKDVRDKEVLRVWQGEPSGAFPACVSSAGVVDLVGNIEEWVTTSRPEWAFKSALKGGFWAKPWAGCRGTNDSHGPMFRFYEVGFRCCKDPG